MESPTCSSKRAFRELQSWRVQEHPSPTLHQPFPNPSPTLCQPFLPTPLQAPLSVGGLITCFEMRVNGILARNTGIYTIEKGLVFTFSSRGSRDFEREEGTSPLMKQTPSSTLTWRDSNRTPPNRERCEKRFGFFFFFANDANHLDYLLWIHRKMPRKLLRKYCDVGLRCEISACMLASSETLPYG